MSIAVPSWAQADISTIRANKSLGQGATRQPLAAEQASQMDSVLSGSMDQLKLVDESDADLKKGQPGVVQMALPEFPGMPQMPIKLDPPVTVYQGDRNTGSSLTEMNQMGVQSVTVTDYSATSVDSITVLGGMMPGTQLMHIDRQNPANSFVEFKGEVWNMIGNAMQGGMMGGAFG